MNGFAKVLGFALLAVLPALAADPGTAESVYADRDIALQLDPASPFWSAAIPAFIEKERFGKPAPEYRTEVRSRWTDKNLYFLFVCPYRELHLKPNPHPQQETNELWNWDVAEVFLGSDFKNIQRYKEFEVSPQGEWVDLDIDLQKPHHEDGWVWNSGFEVLSRIDAEKHVWYAAMKIPFAAIDSRPPAPGNTLRMNLFRSGGPPENPHALAWQPPMNKTFHTPEKFGVIKLVKKEGS
jgi:hypothetical protein